MTVFKRFGKVLFHGSIALSLAVGVAQAQSPLFRVMCINQVGAWAHTGAINELKTRLNSLATQMNFSITHVDANANAEMTAANLATYQVMIWNNNTSIGNVISTSAARTAFQNWLTAGGGMVTVHGVLDHADLWQWMTDNVVGGTRFTVHSPWNSTAGRNAKVRWDELATAGTVRANAAEYDSLRLHMPAGWFTYPDEWYSFSANPRNGVDVLQRIDEATFDVAQAMGTDHPVAWADKLPAVGGGRQGRVIYTARGHDAPAFSGTGTNASPTDVWGTATSPTYNFFKYGICWAVAGQTALTGGTLDLGCRVAPVSLRPGQTGDISILETKSKGGALSVKIEGTGKFGIEIYDMVGHLLTERSVGRGEHLFRDMNKGSLYFVRVKDGIKTHTRQITL